MSTRSDGSGLAVTPDGSYVYVSASNITSIAVISAATDTVVSTVRAVNNPYAVVFSPDGAYAYVTDNGRATVNVPAVPPPLPVVTGISPASGPAVAGTTGTNLSGATPVTFGAGRPATDVVCSAASCTATAPAESQIRHLHDPGDTNSAGLEPRSGTAHSRQMGSTVLN
ncbi:hypothetical protein EF912_06210 [Streptomyces sp. WAC07061]|uniref:YncE family protein n=1 Tax=Streptomyces sp. WAC07061 TaxID=2487410 RepID=UPI000F7B0AF7|nr:hypothetical protein [Streptomyces sp. WAC07061]RSS61731.1 hypothetical protein EF912_06210 [Streptomyces sp. WAC07061]